MPIPPELEEARRLLEDALIYDDPASKFAALDEALDLFDLYIAHHKPLAADEKALIANLRRTHTRGLLAQVVGLKNIRMELWFDYFQLLFFKLKDEVDALRRQDKELNTAYEEFVRLWRDELIEALQRL